MYKKIYMSITKYFVNLVWKTINTLGTRVTPSFKYIFNRPGVAGAVLQPASSFIQ